MNPTSNLLELSGVVACHVVAALLIGLSFRNHVKEQRAAWEFAACVAAWWVGSVGTHVLAATYERSPFFDLGLWFEWRDRYFVFVSQFGVVVSTAFYIWAFQRRHSPTGFSRLVATSLATAASWGLWAILRYLLANSGAIFLHVDDGWLFDLTSEIDRVTLPSWQSAVGWTIWYVGLFGGKPKGTDGVEPVGFNTTGTTA